MAERSVLVAHEQAPTEVRSRARGRVSRGAQRRSTRVMLVSDDGRLAEQLAGVLRADGHQSVWCRSGAEAVSRLAGAELVLLDLGGAAGDGLAPLHELRSRTPIPVFVLSARGDELSVVRGLRSGADDYLVKPVRPHELLARIDAIGRRMDLGGRTERVVRVADLVINLDARTVEALGEPVALTTKEFDVLAVLARRVGTAVSRREILTEVWGEVHLTVSRTLDVHLTALRGKLGRPHLLHTIRGFGYRLG